MNRKSERFEEKNYILNNKIIIKKTIYTTLNEKITLKKKPCTPKILHQKLPSTVFFEKVKIF